MLAPLTPEIAVVAAVLGACLGSFVNVVAWRLPRQESVVRPRSHCPRCGTTLSWHDNIPVLSWLLLRGRCRHCGSSISARYPAVELLCSGLFVAAAAAASTVAAPASNLPGSPALLAVLGGWLLISLLLPMVLIDLDQLWLPEPLCRWGVVLGLVVSAIAGFSQADAIGRSLLLWHLLAASAGLLGFEATSAVAQKLLGKPALGLGDAKLAALLGAWRCGASAMASGCNASASGWAGAPFNGLICSCGHRWLDVAVRLVRRSPQNRTRGARGPGGQRRRRPLEQVP